MNPPMYLANKNPHPRDNDIIFDEGPHIYTIKGDSSFTSVTTWNHTHFEKFNADRIIDNMMKSKNWQNNKYFGKTKQEIKDLWKKNGHDAAASGTKMHYDIECYYNECANVNDSIEYQYFKDFLKTHGHLKAYRTEWMIYHEELKLAGSIDMVYEEEDGSLLIYDWKRCRNITKTNGWNKYATTKCIDHLPDTNYWHYCLQLNVYKAILEDKYNKNVGDLYLVCLHPENDNKSFKKIKVVDLQTEVKELFEERKKTITQTNLKKNTIYNIHGL